MPEDTEIERGSSPASRGGAGVYIEGELGAFYLLAMMAGTEARGMPGAKLTRVRFQGVDHGFTMDDLILEATGSAGSTLLEIQSKRDITFAPKDTTFAEVATQVARSKLQDVPEDQHMLAVATQRQSKSISGPYQDVLIWARAANSSLEFFSRIATKGVGSDPMRTFVETFRANLVAAGVADNNDAIWKLFRRFSILVFDFESTAPLARLHALALARQVLADEDVSRTESLWSNLIEISIETGKVGGAINRDELREKLRNRGFRFAGDRDYRPARARLADLARMTLAAIGTTVGGANLSRGEAVSRLNNALDAHRFVILDGGPGTGKSGVLKRVAERIGRESQLIFLDPVSTPAGGWLAFARAIGVPGSARDFLNDLVASGGGLIAIDGMEMLADDLGRQRTINELLREAVAIPGFSVLATTRSSHDTGAGYWIADDIIEGFGGVHSVEVSELTDEEVEILPDQTPELRAILATGHPAASISRNLYRLSRLLKVPASTEIRTEAALAIQWWSTADNLSSGSVRAGQRILADLAEASLAGGTELELREDSGARSHLTRSLTLTEIRRDHFAFYHDVLRDWGIGNLLHENRSRLSSLDLTVRCSPRIARGIEIGARLALETSHDCVTWQDLLDSLSPLGAHSSWRRSALLAIVRSEVGPALLERCSEGLLARGAALFAELVTVIAAADTISMAEFYTSLQVVTDIPVPKSLRANTTGTGYRLLKWVLAHQKELPVQGIRAVIDLVEIQIHLLQMLPKVASATATMLFDWLRQLDVREAKVTIPSDLNVERLDTSVRRRMIEDLRTMALLLSVHSPEGAKAYLRQIDAERDTYKVKAIRQFASVLALAAPAELANLVGNSLIEKPRRRRSPYRESHDRAFSHADTDYLPASPAQPPFLELLIASPKHGLALVRRLVGAAVESHSGGAQAKKNGFTVVFDDGPRFFPWVQTYFWSRDQAREYSAASGLKALEAWGHHRMDAGEPIDAIVADILGPVGSCAAYLLVAVDVLLSHFPTTRSALVPFLASPDLLAVERTRNVHDQMDRGGFVIGDEPSGRVTLADLRAKPSRNASLENVLPAFLSADADAKKLRTRLLAAVGLLDPYDDRAGFGDPEFMGRYALNVLDQENWIEVEGGHAYQSPADEASHLKRLSADHGHQVRESEMEARIQLAIEGSEHSNPTTARDAVEYVDGGFPDDSDTDSLKSRSTRLVATALLVARDGDDDILDQHEEWVRKVIRLTLAEKEDRYSDSGRYLRFNRPALATLALLHLWRRRGLNADRHALMSIVGHRNGAVVPAFAAALPMIAEIDARLLKAAVRTAFTGSVWRWHPHDEDEAAQKRFEEERDANIDAAVSAEMAWLDGGAEPAWPAFPDEKPILRTSYRNRHSGTDESELENLDDEVADGSATIRVDSQSAAKWLRLLNEPSTDVVGWSGEIVTAYSNWSGQINGARLPAEAEVDHSPSEWNTQFYALYAKALLDAESDQFELLVEQVTGLPDKAFGEVAETLLHAADVLYFNDGLRPPRQAVELRARLATRSMSLRRWRYNYSPGDLSIDYDTGGVVAKLFLNTHDPFRGTHSYLVPGVAERLDPLLDAMRPLLPGGPTSFVALCTMNMLNVAPRATHLDFLLTAVEAWFQRLPLDASLWITMGVGRKVMEWFETAIVEEPKLLSATHPQRFRIDRLLGQLVSVGVAEAHELEKRVESASANIC
jgi:hypothetical protein